MSPSLSPLSNQSTAASSACLEFDWPHHSDRHTAAAFSLFLSKYSGEREFALTFWHSHRNQLLQTPIHILSDSTLGTIITSEIQAHHHSSPTLLILQSQLPQQLRDLGFEFACCLPCDGETSKESNLGQIHYRSDLFTPETVASWIKHLLKIASYPPETLIREIEMLDSAEQQQALTLSGNPEPTLYPSPDPANFTFPALFEEQCARTPTNRALWCQGEEWSYQKLNEFSNQVANQLRETNSISVGVRVGVSLERDPEFLAVLLGIMKAGGSYVPLEPDLPESRRDFIAKDAAVKTTIDRPWLQQLVQDQPSKESPSLNLTSEDAAYLIYTSGSTGEPKGVEVPHRALCDFSLVMRETYSLQPEHTWLAITTIAFDACIMELFPLLLTGGTVALAPPRLGADGEALSNLLRETASTHLWATPTTLRILVSSGWQGDSKLTIFSGGEAVDREIAETVLPLCKTLVNGYGPTETTVFATNHIITSGTGPVPLGRPMAHMTMYLLDEDGHPLPPMARGHYWIGGQGVTNGYLNRPDLTAERFRKDPFSTRQDARMYQSGDVGYRDQEGTLHYLGRSDHQVKLRGYRIELGEIEARLLAHPAIEEAAVLVREDQPGEQRLVAYLIAPSEPSPESLQEHLATQLPEYMIPAWFVPLASFPLTAGRKLDRRALPAPPEPEAPSDSTDPNTSTLATSIAALWARLLGRPRISADDHVFRLGANSLNATRFQALLAKELNHELPIAQIFQHPTPTALANHLLGQKKQRQTTIKEQATGPIAIVGMACRFPGAPDLESYWDLIQSGKEAIQTFSQEELIASGISPAEIQDPNYVPRGTVLEKALDFEPSFFGVSPQDASILSPQFRLFMKTSWEALENAGYPNEPEDEPIGIFAGAGDSAHHLNPTRDQPEPDRLKVLVGNSSDFLATRTSFALGLTGPAVAVQTACSTSLVAIAEACHALRAGRCAMALAGGVSFSWPHAQGYLAGEGLMFSPSGACRPFDHRADGTLFSQGAGVVLLKPLQQALDDGDPIHAVIRGIATNNDGSRKASYAAPSIEGQREVIRQALDDAQLSAREVGYIEAHGTGTKIGDPIEVAALTNAYREDTEDNSFCNLGSVKGNIGHTDAAAGVAGLIKSALALHHRILPPSLHFEKANSEIIFEKTPFQVRTKRQNWEQINGDKPRIAAVSALGMGGTNAHAILQESPLSQKRAQNTPTQSWHLLPLSARSPEALQETVTRFPLTPTIDRAAAAYTLAHGRRVFPHRAFTIATADGPLPDFELHEACTEEREPVFLFTGQGSQYARMGESLLKTEPVFREAIDECARHLPNGLSWLYPESDEEACDINQTSLTQPALFSVMWAQAKLWQSWGIQPVAMAGHSIGEYVAATLAGVFTLKDALEIVTKRSQLMQSAQPGTMLAIFADSDRIEEVLCEYPELDLAAINAPDLSVVAGDTEVIEKAAEELTKEGTRCRTVRTSHAFHSRSMEPVLAEFEELLSTYTLSPPQIPYPSNVTGDWITPEQATSPQYYAKQLRGTVRFSDNVSTLTTDVPPRLLLEMGPGATLSSLAARQLGNTPHDTLQTFADRKITEATTFARKALGHAWAKGLSLPLPTEPQRRISLPPTVFSEETFEKPSKEEDSQHPPSPLFHLPTWKQEPLHLPATEPSSQPWLIFSRSLLHRALDFRGLRELTKNAIHVTAGKTYRRVHSRHYVIRSNEPSDYLSLLETVFSERGAPAGILHTWSLDNTSQSPTDIDSFRDSLASSAASLTWLAKALSKQPLQKPLPLTILTSGIQDHNPIPANHTLPATASVIQKEIPAIMTKVLEVGKSTPTDLLPLIRSPQHYPHLAYRDHHWWSPTFSPVPLSEKNSPPAFQRDETIIVTGGLGGLALATCLGLAEHTPGVRFILLARHPEATSSYQKDSLSKIESLGCEVHLIKMDLLDSSSITEAVAQIAKDSSPLAGVLHTAGILEDAAIAGKDPDSYWRVLSTKVLGAQLLSNQLIQRNLKPRFEIFFSSVASDLGLFGQIDYSAANAYLDGYATQLRKRGIQSHSINWPAFHSVGMAARTRTTPNTQTPGFGLSLTDELATNALAPSEAAPTILSILGAKSHPRVAISRQPFRDKQEAAIADGRATRIASREDGEELICDIPPQERMLQIWRTHLGLPDLQEDDDYFEAGGDSLAAVSLTASIEKAFGCPVPISHLMGSPTSAGLLDRLGLSEDPASNSASELPPFLHILHPGEKGKPPLVLIHGGSGGILFLHPFASQLATGHPIYAFEAPMLHDLEATAPDSMEILAAQYLAVLHEHLPEPFILGGYSFGGIVAYEMAQQLQKQGTPPLQIILFDTPNPVIPVNKNSLPQRLTTFWKTQEDAKRITTKLARLAHRLGTGAVTRLNTELVKRLSKSAKASTKEHWRHRQCLEQHTPLEDAYEPQPYSGQLTVFITDFVHDKFTYAENLGWSDMADQLQVSTITGPHLEIFNPPHLETLLAATRDCLTLNTQKIPPHNPNKEKVGNILSFPENPASKDSQERSG